MFRKQLEILTIGDIATDAFIRLDQEHAHASMNKDKRELCVGFGEKIPFEYVKVINAAGNAANAAVSGARLGLRTAILSNVGDDAIGRECIVELRNQKIDTTLIRTEKFKKTNYHFVLWYGDDRTILVNHADFDYQLPEVFRKNNGLGLPPKWIYLSSLAANAFPYEMKIADYLESNPDVKLAFQPGTYQIKSGADKLKRLYSRSEIIIVNVEEAHKILETRIDRIGSSAPQIDIKILLNGLASLGPKLVAITDGTRGSYLFDGDHYYHIPIYEDPRPALERTGCGDAWASTFVSALVLGLSPLEALTWAPVNAMSVAQFIGSREGLLTLDQLNWWLDQAPEHYKPKEI
ncbi:MAG: carbohydrate kinase family protein [Candidatus Paceibacterota bacterium]|jgi:ribokinase